jgi:hypothetical protein
LRGRQRSDRFGDYGVTCIVAALHHVFDNVVRARCENLICRVFAPLGMFVNAGLSSALAKVRYDANRGD